MVERRKDSVVGSLVVVAGWLEVVQVRERGRVVGSQVLNLVRFSVVDVVGLLSVHVLHNVVLHNWGLGHGSILGSGGVDISGITESEDTLMSAVLQGVWVDVNQSTLVSKSRVLEPLVWVGRWNNIS